MKTPSLKLLASVVLILSGTLNGQTQRVEATTITPTVEGTVSEFGPEGMVIKSAPGAQPVRYISKDTTNYVDENGNPIAPETVRPGLPVTIHYIKVGDTLFASKIVVKSASSVPATTSPTQTTSTPPKEVRGESSAATSREGKTSSKEGTSSSRKERTSSEDSEKTSSTTVRERDTDSSTAHPRVEKKGGSLEDSPPAHHNARATDSVESTVRNKENAEESKEQQGRTKFSKGETPKSSEAQKTEGESKGQTEGQKEKPSDHTRKSTVEENDPKHSKTQGNPDANFSKDSKQSKDEEQKNGISKGKTDQPDRPPSGTRRQQQADQEDKSERQPKASSTDKTSSSDKATPRETTDKERSATGDRKAKPSVEKNQPQ